MKIENLIHKAANNAILKKFVPKKSLTEVHDYWLSQNTDGPNSYVAHMSGEDRSLLLLEKINDYFSQKDIKILEIGCNVGRNLNVLFKDGYRNLTGIEINSNAVRAMKEHYPEMAKTAKIFNSKIEDKIKDFKSQEFDLVFTMAVLMHIHTESEWIFDEMARITNKYLVTIEDESGVATKNFPRNYKEVFEKRGMKEIKSFENLSCFSKDHKMRIFAPIKK